MIPWRSTACAYLIMANLLFPGFLFLVFNSPVLNCRLKNCKYYQNLLLTPPHKQKSAFWTTGLKQSFKTYCQYLFVLVYVYRFPCLMRKQICVQEYEVKWVSIYLLIFLFEKIDAHIFIWTSKLINRVVLSDCVKVDLSMISLIVIIKE